MPGGNWAYNQQLHNGRVEWPWGPLTVDPGFNPTWLQSWIVQGGPPTSDETSFYPGPVQSTSQSAFWSGFTPNYWTATEPGWLSGSFTPGPAVGIAVLATDTGGGGTTNYEYEFWIDLIMLY
jgi:hypothetical protein